MPDPAPVLIFDLDGTVLSVNSFPHWAMAMLRARLPHLGALARLRVRLAVGFALAGRKTKMIDHERLKWRLQRIWPRITAGRGGPTATAFTEHLLQHVRPEMRPLLNLVASRSADAVLATAAAADYAEALGVRLGFQHVLATPTGRPRPGISNVGVAKREAVLQFLRAQGWERRPRILFTDHHDDVPLIAVCDETVWYGPDRLLADVRAHVPGAQITARAAFTPPTSLREPVPC